MVEHDKDQKIFFMIEDGFKAFLRYEITDGRIDVLTTQVPEEISGRGIARNLMDECFRFANERSYEFVPKLSCSYARAHLLKKSRT